METEKEIEEEVLETLSYTPKTSLGKQLIEKRKEIIASGEAMLGWEEIEKEVAERRGEYESRMR